ncbi:MAG: hypothetical protein EA366_14795 [Spirulina sp. DLM2.Bin59]|nr:MAG: hypothetical protein EA366_14795 [Spirulina sp. DLM2.Bin59]
MLSPVEGQGSHCTSLGKPLSGCKIFHPTDYHCFALFLAFGGINLGDLGEAIAPDHPGSLGAIAVVERSF